MFSPAVFVLDDSLVPRKFILQRGLVCSQLSTVVGVFLERLLCLLNIFPEGLDLYILYLDFIIVALLCGLDGLFQHGGLRETDTWSTDEDK